MNNIISKVPTGELRQVKRDAGRVSFPVLQQQFKVIKEVNGKAESSTEWQDVPTVNEVKNED